MNEAQIPQVAEREKVKDLKQIAAVLEMKVGKVRRLWKQGKLVIFSYEGELWQTRAYLEEWKRTHQTVAQPKERPRGRRVPPPDSAGRSPVPERVPTGSE